MFQFALSVRFPPLPVLVDLIARTNARAHMHARTRMHTCMHTHAHMHAHAHLHAHAHAHTETCTRTCTHACTHAHACKRTRREDLRRTLHAGPTSGALRLRADARPRPRDGADPIETLASFLRLPWKCLAFLFSLQLESRRRQLLRQRPAAVRGRSQTVVVVRRGVRRDRDQRRPLPAHGARDGVGESQTLGRARSFCTAASSGTRSLVCRTRPCSCVALATRGRGGGGTFPWTRGPPVSRLRIPRGLSEGQGPGKPCSCRPQCERDDFPFLPDLPRRGPAWTSSSGPPLGRVWQHSRMERVCRTV